MNVNLEKKKNTLISPMDTQLPDITQRRNTIVAPSVVASEDDFFAQQTPLKNKTIAKQISESPAKVPSTTTKAGKQQSADFEKLKDEMQG